MVNSTLIMISHETKSSIHARMFVCLLAKVSNAEASRLFTNDCSSILTTDRHVSILSDQDLEPLKDIPLYSSAAGSPLALMIGPSLSGREVQVEIAHEGRKFVRGRIKGSDDDWASFWLREAHTGALLLFQAEHPELGTRRIEFLDQNVAHDRPENDDRLSELEDNFMLEAKDLKVNAMSVKYESTMAWYRKWNGRFLRTTLYDRQDTLSRLEYLLGLNQVEEAMALLRLDVDKTKIPAVAIDKAIKLIAELDKMVATNDLDRNRISRLRSEAEARLKKEGVKLGRSYGEYRAAYLRLKKIEKNEKGLYPPQKVAAARRVLEQMTVINPSARLMPNLLGRMKDPNLDFIQSAFFAQPYSLEAKLKRDLWAERMTFCWMFFNKVTLQEVVQRSVDRVSRLLPAPALSAYNSLRKSKRDMDARHFDLPQIERIAHSKQLPLERQRNYERYGLAI